MEVEGDEGPAQSQGKRHHRDRGVRSWVRNWLQPRGRAGVAKQGCRAAQGWLTPAVISFLAGEQWLKNKAALHAPAPLHGLPQAERTESRSPAPSARLSEPRPSASGCPAPAQAPETRPPRPGWHGLPPLPGPALGQQPGESPRDEGATAQWDALSALAAPSAQRPGAGPSLTPRRLPSRPGICE